MTIPCGISHNENCGLMSHLETDSKEEICASTNSKSNTHIIRELSNKYFEKDIVQPYKKL